MPVILSPGGTPGALPRPPDEWPGTQAGEVTSCRMPLALLCHL